MEHKRRALHDRKKTENDIMKGKSMTQVKDLFIEGKPFKAEALNIQGYSINEAGKFTVKREKFKNSLDVKVEIGQLLNALALKGKVYTYTKKGRIKAVYIVRRNEDNFSCDEIYYAKDIENEPITNLMDQQVAFLVAQRASYSEKGTATFRKEPMPQLTQLFGKYNWGMALCFTMLMSTGFVLGSGTLVSILPGIGFGFAMGLCFRESWYQYILPETEVPQAGVEAAN